MSVHLPKGLLSRFARAGRTVEVPTVDEVGGFGGQVAAYGTKGVTEWAWELDDSRTDVEGVEIDEEGLLLPAGAYIGYLFAEPAVGSSGTISVNGGTPNSLGTTMVIDGTTDLWQPVMFRSEEEFYPAVSGGAGQNSWLEIHLLKVG